MKMGDAFNLPLRAEPGGVMPYVKDEIGCVQCVIDDGKAEAVALAVNMHDELVEMLKRMIVLAIDLDNSLFDERGTGEYHEPCLIAGARQLIAKSRGEHG